MTKSRFTNNKTFR